MIKKSIGAVVTWYIVGHVVWMAREVEWVGSNGDTGKKAHGTTKASVKWGPLTTFQLKLPKLGHKPNILTDSQFLSNVMLRPFSFLFFLFFLIKKSYKKTKGGDNFVYIMGGIIVAFSYNSFICNHTFRKLSP